MPNPAGGLSFSWTGFSPETKTPVPLTAANQASTPRLFFPARSLPVGLAATATLTVSYAGTPDRRAADTASTSFVVAAAPLVVTLRGANTEVGARRVWFPLFPLVCSAARPSLKCSASVRAPQGPRERL